MSICKLCGQEMLEANGCTCEKIRYNGKTYDRIRFGEEFDMYAGAVGEEERCPDCGTKAGRFHHFGCDIENCPVCHGQMLGDCHLDEFITDEI